MIFKPEKGCQEIQLFPDSSFETFLCPYRQNSFKSPTTFRLSPVRQPCIFFSSFTTCSFMSRALSLMREFALEEVRMEPKSFVATW